MSENIDERAVGRHEGLLMAVSWVEACERAAEKARERWRGHPGPRFDMAEAVRLELERLAQDLHRKASEMIEAQAFLEGRGHVVGECDTCDSTGLVPFGLPSDGPVPCPECGPDDKPAEDRIRPQDGPQAR